MVERTLPKPDTRVRFPSAAPKAPDFVAGLFPRLKRESLPGGNTFPRALGISAFQPVSRSKSLLPHGRRLFILGWMWWLGSVGRVEAVCSLLLQGTRPRFASDTLMSRRNIPASPLLIPPPCGARWGRGCALWNEPRATLFGKTVRERGGGMLGLGTANSLPRMKIGFRAPTRRFVHTRLSYTFLKRHQGARALRGWVPL